MTIFAMENENIPFSNLNGLRGLASLHVLFQHYMYQILRIVVCGTHAMPLFFLLSGFSLALAYGKKDPMGIRDMLRFCKNRFSRIIPTYYLLTILDCVIRERNFSELIGDKFWETILNLLCFTSWTYPLCSFFSIGCSHPFLWQAWTIHTLIFFYISFPILFNVFQGRSNKWLFNCMVFCFYLQLVPWYYVGSQHAFANGPKADNLYWTVVCSPESRLPVFCMGVLAGILHTRQSGTDHQLKQMDNLFLFDLIPVPAVLGLPKRNNSSCQEVYARRWRLKVDLYSILLILYCVWGYYEFENKRTMGVFYYGQLFVPFIQMMVIVGLYNDKGQSMLSKLCRLKPVQLLGDMSMTLYLIHMTLLKLLENKGLQSMDPVMQVLVATCVSIIAAYLITVFYEAPLRSWLRGDSWVSVPKVLKTRNALTILTIISFIAAALIVNLY